MTTAEMTTFLGGRITLHAGDCLDRIKLIADASIDSVVTDPPYALVSITSRLGKPNSAPIKDRDGVYRRAAAGFMGKSWDVGDRAFAVEFWAEVYRVLKPGGHVLAFGGTRTVHRLTCAIEDGGFEIRDQIGWAFGSGFPKSHDAGNGWGTALKPAWEPITMARKPLIGTVRENVLTYGTGALNIAACRIDATGDPQLAAKYASVQNAGCRANSIYGADSRDRAGASPHANGRWPANVIHDGSDEVVAAFPETTTNPGTLQASAARGMYSSERAAGTRLSVGDSGSAARFFYNAKADSDDRIGSKHPTVKPVDLMRYLVRLVTPPGGVVLDPFAGTGTTGEAAYREGFSAVLIEREDEYRADIARRMDLILAGPGERRNAIVKAKDRPDDMAGTLFDSTNRGAAA